MVDRPTADVSPEALASYCAGGIETCRGVLEEILSVSGKRTSANSLEPLNRLYFTLGSLRCAASLLRSVYPDAVVRGAAEVVEQELSRFSDELNLNRSLYDAIFSTDLAGLDKAGKRFVEHVLRDFRRAGVDREPSVREEVRQLREDLVALGQDFKRNIVSDVRSIVAGTSSDLEGLPEDYVQEHAPDESGEVRITTDYPDYNPFMQYAKDGELRRKLYSEFRRRAYPDNLQVLDQILQKRYQMATLLGYPSWAAYVTEDKMIGNPEAVDEFICRVSDVAEARARREYATLLEQKRQDEPGATEVFDWEKAYYEERVKALDFSVDSKALRSYFEYFRVKNGIMQLTQALFDVSFEAVPDAPRWHADVEVFDILQGHTPLGRVYLDMHPREGKFKHAAMFPLVSGLRGLAIPEAALICNFPDPRRSQGPALLEHDDVVTFFHEFGHLLHHIFGGQQDWESFSGCATEWDFVEVPSQLYEEWAWDYQVLQRFAVHHESGETIPQALVDKMRKARSFGRGVGVRHQMFYAALSLACHDKDPSGQDTTALMSELQKKHSVFQPVEGTYFQASFGHLDDYSAIYYTYMWSLVISKDLFQQFKRDGALSSTMAGKYRRAILAPGGSKDASELVEDFLGRPYTFDAFEAWINEE